MSVYEKIYKEHGLSQTQKEIIKLVGKNKKVLEIGASSGYMTKYFLKNKCIVDVVEKDKNSFRKIPKMVRAKFNFSIEGHNLYRRLSKDYNFIIMADVLEHLIDPAKTLQKLKKIASKNTKLIISLPNIASWLMRKQLFFDGDFEYQESGMLDKTHLHFYTVKTLPKLLEDNGWKVEKIIGTIIRLPLESIIGKIPLLKKIMTEEYQNLSYYHFITIAQIK